MSTPGFAVPADAVLISDGGLATELEARGHDLSDDLWSARLLSEDPQEIVAVHEAFFRAGAQIATTASYQASFGDSPAGESTPGRRRTPHAPQRRVGQVRPGYRAGAGLVAASVGPYGAMLARRGVPRALRPQCRRTGRVAPPATGGADRHRAGCPCAGDDPGQRRGRGAGRLVHELRAPAWLSYTIDGDATRAGQPLEEAFAVTAGALSRPRRSDYEISFKRAFDGYPAPGQGRA